MDFLRVRQRFWNGPLDEYLIGDTRGYMTFCMAVLREARGVACYLFVGNRQRIRPDDHDAAEGALQVGEYPGSDWPALIPFRDGVCLVLAALVSAFYGFFS
jgi:hypothetical protein